MNDALECCLPIFNLLKPFLLQHVSEVSLDFRESITAQFIQFERDAASHPLGVKTIEHVKYALAALVDECVMYSSWSGKWVWMQRSLQLQFFGDHRAGEVFFERLSQLRQAGHPEIDALEIYALCMQCGFQGIYRFRDHTQFVALKAGLESQINGIRGAAVSTISQAVSVENIDVYTSDKPLLWIGVIALAIIFFIWMGYRIIEMKRIHYALSVLTTLQQEGGYDS